MGAPGPYLYFSWIYPRELYPFITMDFSIGFAVCCGYNYLITRVPGPFNSMSCHRRENISDACQERRLHYELLTGEGPRTGWVSSATSDRRLPQMVVKSTLPGGGFKDFLFSILPGEIIQFD